MVNDPKLLVVIPFLTEENFSPRFKKSICNIKEKLLFRVFFLFIQQGEYKDNLKSWLSENEYKLINLSVKNVSASRNIGISYAENYKFSHIIFHDIRVYFDIDASYYISNAIYFDGISKLKVGFGRIEKSRVRKKMLFSSSQKYRNVLTSPYVSSYIFRINKICKFDESVGLGEKNRHKSGEDSWFLFNVFGSFIFQVKESNYCFVLREKRIGYEKHLKYARGQGFLIKRMMRKEKSVSLYVFSFLFYCNAIIRCFLFDKIHFKILIERIKGYYD